MEKERLELIRRVIADGFHMAKRDDAFVYCEELAAEVERLREALDWCRSQAAAIGDGIEKRAWPVDQTPIVSLSDGIMDRCTEALAADRDDELLKQMGPQKNDRKGWGEPIGKRLHSDPNEHGPRCAAHYVGSDGKQYPCNCDRQESEDV